ncbi:MAG: hypothetical protein PUE41_04375 [bacterium]|nr:hypothetical protein [bacterium]
MAFAIALRMAALVKGSLLLLKISTALLAVLATGRSVRFGHAARSEITAALTPPEYLYTMSIWPALSAMYMVSSLSKSWSSTCSAAGLPSGYAAYAANSTTPAAASNRT